MARLREAWKMLTIASGVVICLLVLGFLVFASVVSGYPYSTYARADAIVVLTGGENRVADAIRLFSERRAPRLFVSGVHRHTGKNELRRLGTMDEELFRCCFDIGHAAYDTLGNAYEVRAWAEGKGLQSIILVTSSYHMPRSLAEVGRVLPGVRLIPNAVRSPHVRVDRWWTDAGAVRLLLLEFAKFIPAAGRYGIDRLLRVPDPAGHPVVLGASPQFAGAAR